MENRKVTFDHGGEVELDADVAAEIEAARAANENQLQRVRTAMASMSTGQRRHAWDAYRLLVRARTDADKAQRLAAVIQAGDAELTAAVKAVIGEIEEARLHQDRERAKSPPTTPGSRASRGSERLLAAETRVEQAEDAMAGERSRADALRSRLDEAQEELRLVREAADQAHQHARDAEDAIAALRQADDKRKARGRWARLRAAWRGD